MKTVNREFLSFVSELSVEGLANNELSKQELDIIYENASKEIDLITTTEGDPFAFILWFFKHPSRKSFYPLLPDPETASVSFYKNYVSFTFHPHNLSTIPKKIKNDLEYRYFFTDEQEGVVNGTVVFESLLSDLLVSEFEETRRVLLKIWKDKINENEKDKTFRKWESICGSLNPPTSYNHQSDYSLVFIKQLRSFQEKISNFLYSLNPRIQQTETIPIKGDLTILERKDLLRALYEIRLSTAINPIVFNKEKNQFHRFENLFWNQDMREKVYFDCTALEVGYILKLIRNRLKLELDMTALGNNECIIRLNKGRYVPMAHTNLLKVTQPKKYPKKTYQEIDKIFSSTKTSTK